MKNNELTLKDYKDFAEMLRIGRRAAHKAQEESRAMGVPNVYSINGILYYELPNGELSREDPYDDASLSQQPTE